VKDTDLSRRDLLAASAATVALAAASQASAAPAAPQAQGQGLFGLGDPSFPPHTWRLTKSLGGGGLMFDYGIYGVNGTLMLMDEAMPTQVSAIYTTPAGDPRFTQVEGGVLWRMRFASGATAQGSASYASASTNRQLAVGTTGSLSMEPANVYDRNAGRLKRNRQPDALLENFTSMQQFVGQIDGFSQAARANVPHRTPGEMGLRDIALIEAIYRSADADGAVVKL